MKGISIFYDQQVIRLHPNAYTEAGYGSAIPPFVTLEAEIDEPSLRATMQEMLAQSQSDVPFKMVSAAEAKAYLEAFGLRHDRQLGKGVHIVQQKGRLSVTPINKRGLFGKSLETDIDHLPEVVKHLLDLPERQAVAGSD